MKSQIYRKGKLESRRYSRFLRECTTGFLQSRHCDEMEKPVSQVGSCYCELWVIFFCQHLGGSKRRVYFSFKGWTLPSLLCLPSSTLESMSKSLMQANSNLCACLRKGAHCHFSTTRSLLSSALCKNQPSAFQGPMTGLSHISRHSLSSQLSLHFIGKNIGIGVCPNLDSTT